jgi:hypothetical protein
MKVNWKSRTISLSVPGEQCEITVLINAWDYFPHDRVHAYRWNEDGLGGSTRHTHVRARPLEWADAFSKERLFSLTGSEVIARCEGILFLSRLTPTHSYEDALQYHRAFPYTDLETSRQRGRRPNTSCLMGIFNESLTMSSSNMQKPAPRIF